MPINLASIKNELFPGLRGIEGRYEQIPTQWDKVFARGTSNMALERTSEVRFLGTAKIKTEGGSILCAHSDQEFVQQKPFLNVNVTTFLDVMPDELR